MSQTGHGGRNRTAADRPRAPGTSGARSESPTGDEYHKSITSYKGSTQRCVLQDTGYTIFNAISTAEPIFGAKWVENALVSSSLINHRGSVAPLSPA